MHWDKAALSAGPARPYQGVRVRDPVRELLRRKRGLEQHDGTKTAPPAVDVSPHHNLSPYAPGSSFGFGGAGVVQAGDVDTGPGPCGGPPCGDWAIQQIHQGAPTFQPPQALQAAPAWCPVDYAQQQHPSPAQGPQPYQLSRGLAGDVYMKTLGPSYALVGPPHTLLTYTHHAPLLTGFGMEGPEAGLTYLPWGAPPLAAISTLPPPTVQLAACSAALPRPGPVHRPLSGPVPVPVSRVRAPPTRVEVFQEPERSVFPQPVHEDPPSHRHHPNLGASMEQASGGPLDHLVEPEVEQASGGPLDHLVEPEVEQASGGPLDHLVEQASGPLDHLVEPEVEQASGGPLDHLVQQGPLDHLVEPEVEQASGPLDHLVDQGPLDHLVEQGPLDHLVEQASGGPLDHLMEQASGGPLDHLVEQGPLDHLMEQASGGPLDHLVEQASGGPLDHLVEQGPLDHLVEPEVEPMNPLEKLLEEQHAGGDEEEGEERYSNSLFLDQI